MYRKIFTFLLYYVINLVKEAATGQKEREIWNWKCSLLIAYRTYNFSWAVLFLKMGSTVCPETLVTNYQSTLRKISEERRYYLHRAESLDYITSTLYVTMGVGHFWNYTDRRQEKYSEKNLSATLFSSNPTQTDLGVNPGLLMDRLTAQPWEGSLKKIQMWWTIKLINISINRTSLN